MKTERFRNPFKIFVLLSVIFYPWYARSQELVNRHAHVLSVRSLVFYTDRRISGDEFGASIDAWVNPQNELLALVSVRFGEVDYFLYDFSRLGLRYNDLCKWSLEYDEKAKGFLIRFSTTENEVNIRYSLIVISDEWVLKTYSSHDGGNADRLVKTSKGCVGEFSCFQRLAELKNEVPHDREEE